MDVSPIVRNFTSINVCYFLQVLIVEIALRDINNNLKAEELTFEFLVDAQAQINTQVRRIYPNE